MTTVSYLTLADGTLIDFEHDHDKRVLIMRAGKSLYPHERPILLSLTDQDAREMGLHLAAFIATVDTLEGTES